MKTRIYSTATTDHPDYGDQSPLYESIRVFFDHDNYELSDINNISDAILAMDIDHGMDCGFSACDILHEIKKDPSPSLTSIFTPLANDLVRLGMLGNTGYLEIETEYLGLLYSVGVKIPVYSDDIAANILRQDIPTLRKWAESGRLPAIREPKKRGGFLKFPKISIHDELSDHISMISSNLISQLGKSLVGLFVKLNDGNISMIRFVEIDRSSTINVFVDEYGWFSLSGKSLSQGSGSSWQIIDYYVNPKMAE